MRVACTAIAAVLVAAVAVPLALGAGVADASTTDPGIGLSSAVDLVAVGQSGGLPARLVAAGAGPDGAEVVVTDGTGTNPVPVPISRPTALALGPDGRTVWVATQDNAVVSFPVDHPTEVSRYRSGGVACVGDLAVAGSGVVYLVAGCGNDAKSVRMLDPSDEQHRVSEPVVVGRVPASTRGQLFLTNIADHPNLLAVSNHFDWIDLLDLAGDTASEIGSISEKEASDLVVAPDARSIVVATYDTPRSYAPIVQRYSVGAAPQPVGAPIRGAYSGFTGLALDDTDTYVAATDGESARSYGPTSTKLLHLYTPPDGYAADHGVAWVGRTLITMVDTGDAVSLRPHADATYLPSTLQLFDPTVGSVDQDLTIHGVLRARGQPVAGADLTIVRTDREGTRVVGAARTEADGTFRTTDVPRIGLRNTYRVAYAGGSTVLSGDKTSSTSASITATIERLPTYLSVHTDKVSYDFGDLAVVTAHLGTTYRDRDVGIYAQTVGLGKHRLRYAHVDSSGRLTASYRITRNTNFSATFFGDLRRAPVSATVFRGARPAATQRFTGYYATASDGYRMFHQDDEASLRVHLDPGKQDQCAFFDLQERIGGDWRARRSSSCFHVNAYSNAFGYWSFHQFAVVGRDYRVRMTYGGDRLNIGLATPWRYLTVTAPRFP